MKKMNILIIDDSSTTRYFLSSILSEQGHIIHQANDGANGLKTIDKKYLKNLRVVEYELDEPKIIYNWEGEY